MDLLDRYLCLRTLVEVTALAASNISESARIVAKWIRVSDEARVRLGNYFGFYSIASGLSNSEHLLAWSALWAQLKEDHFEEWQLLHGPIRESIRIVTDMSEAMPAQTTLPHLIPYLVDSVDISSKTVEAQRKEITAIATDCDQCCDLSIFEAHCEQAYGFAAQHEAFRKSAQLAFRHINTFEDLLLDLFRTEFHIRLLWGTNGVVDYPNNFDERHAKFAKVLTALASICTRQ
jgi:hypothetical protein